QLRFTPDAHPAVAATVSNPVTITSLDNADYRDAILMLGTGSNDVPEIQAATLTVAEVAENTGRILATMRPLTRRFLLWGPLDRGASEGAATARGIIIRQIEAQFAAIGGENWLPLRELLVSEGLSRAGITPTTQDGLDVAAGAVPQSLRDASSIHLNAA